MLTYQGLLSPLASPQAAVVSVATAVPGRRGAGGRRGTAANDINLRNVVCRSLLGLPCYVFSSAFSLLAFSSFVSFRVELTV